MSELTSYNSERIYWAVEQVEREAGDIDDLHLDDNLFYLKSEADKAIAELKAIIEERDKTIEGLQADYKEACDRLQTANLIKDEQLAATRHQKYKRCEAMAKWCRSRACFYDTMRENSLYWGWKSDRAYKWHKRWLELAEKFKEAK